MGSSRLPGKIIMPIGRLNLFEIIFHRVSSAKLVNDCVFATTTSLKDDIFCQTLNDKKINYFRGSEEDVLSRYLGAAKKFKADVIVRVTCDDPFKDPKIIDKCLQLLNENQLDFCSNIISKTYAEGLDVECFTRETLETLNIRSKKYYEREHVTPFFYENMNEFKWKEIRDEVNMSEYRLTLDDQVDYNILSKIYEATNYNYSISYEEIKKIITLPNNKKKLIGRIPTYQGLNKSKGEFNG